MPSTYRLSPTATERDTNQILVRSLSFNVVIMLIPLFIMLFTGQLSDPKVLVTVLCGFGIVLAIVIWQTIRRTRRMMKNAETYELTIDDLAITRTQRECPAIVIPRDEIKRISERTGQGFRIETANVRQNIWVPRELEGYEEVKSLLLTSAVEQSKTMRHPLAVTYGSSVLVVAGFLTALYSHQKSVVTATGAAVLCFYVYYVFQLARSWSNLSRSMRRILWVCLLPAIFIAVRIVSVWRG